MKLLFELFDFIMNIRTGQHITFYY